MTLGRHLRAADGDVSVLADAVLRLRVSPTTATAAAISQVTGWLALNKEPSKAITATALPDNSLFGKVLVSVISSDYKAAAQGLNSHHLWE